MKRKSLINLSCILLIIILLSGCTETKYINQTILSTVTVVSTLPAATHTVTATVTEPILSSTFFPATTTQTVTVTAPATTTNSIISSTSSSVETTNTIPFELTYDRYYDHIEITGFTGQLSPDVIIPQ
jgi:hypothetical protein